MKNIIYLFLVLSTCLLVSCGDSDSLVGTWVVSANSFTSCDDPDDNETFTGFSAEPCTAQSADGCGYTAFTFTDTAISTVSNFTIAGMVQSDAESGTYTIEGDQITVCIGGECDPATFSIDGDVMTLVITDPSDGCVNTISANKQ